MYTLDLDIPLTRRMTLCTIRNDTDHLVFTSAKASKAFEWLEEHKIKGFWVRLQNHDGGELGIQLEVKCVTLDDEKPTE